MTISILNDCLLLRAEHSDKLQDYFATINVDIFNAIFSTKPPDEAKQIILYILCAYSEESPLVIIRQDTKEEKMGICEYLNIPDFKRRELMELTDIDIRRAATSYLTSFAGPLFKSYKFLQIQVEDIELDITNRAFTIKKTELGKDGAPDVITEIPDVKEHSKAVTEYARLCKQLEMLERQIKQSHLKRMEGIEDLKNFTREGKQAGRISKVRTGNVENVIG